MDWLQRKFCNMYCVRATCTGRRTPGSTDTSPCTQGTELNEYGLWPVVMPMHGHQFKSLTRLCYRGAGTLAVLPDSRFDRT